MINIFSKKNHSHFELYDNMDVGVDETDIDLTWEPLRIGVDGELLFFGFVFLNLDSDARLLGTFESLSEADDTSFE